MNKKLKNKIIDVISTNKDMELNVQAINELEIIFNELNICEYCNGKGYNLQDDNIPCSECDTALNREMF